MPIPDQVPVWPNTVSSSTHHPVWLAVADNSILKIVQDQDEHKAMFHTNTWF